MWHRWLKSMQRSGRWQETPSIAQCGGSIQLTPWPLPSMTSSSLEMRSVNGVLMIWDLMHLACFSNFSRILMSRMCNLPHTYLFSGLSGTRGGEGGSAEGYIFTWRGLSMAGQSERTGVWRGDVLARLPCPPDGGGCFLTEKLTRMTVPQSHVIYPVTVLNQILFLGTCAVLNLHFSTKDHWPCLKCCLETICRNIYIHVYTFFFYTCTLWFKIFFSFMLFVFFSFVFFYAEWFYLLVICFWTFSSTLLLFLFVCLFSFF